MTNMSKTAAIKSARPMVGISGRHTSWQITGPYDCANPDGPSTTHNADSYTKAAQHRAAWVAEIALNLMGVDLTDKDGYVIEIETGGSVDDIVAYYATLTPFESRVESGLTRGETWEEAVMAAPNGTPTT